jgi:hypothetical protein
MQLERAPNRVGSKNAAKMQRKNHEIERAPSRVPPKMQQKCSEKIMR